MYAPHCTKYQTSPSASSARSTATSVPLSGICLTRVLAVVGLARMFTLSCVVMPAVQPSGSSTGLVAMSAPAEVSSTPACAMSVPVLP